MLPFKSDFFATRAYVLYMGAESSEKSIPADLISFSNSCYLDVYFFVKKELEQ